MSLLRQDSEKLDDAALGEELTKGSSHVILATVIAAIVVSVAIALYVIVGQKPPAATGEIEQVWVHPQHTETSGFDANGAAMAKESFDQIYVFAKVKLTNQSKEPLFLHEILTNVTLDDGIHSSYAATRTDYERLFIGYPSLGSLHGTTLPPETTIPPGQTVEGTFVSAFRLNKQQWDARKDWLPDPNHSDPESKSGLNFTFSIQYQRDLVLAPQTAVMEQ